MSDSSIIETLLGSAEPSIRWKVRTGALGEDPNSPGVQALREQVRSSDRVRILLERRDSSGVFQPADNVYAKWQGAQWAMMHLADIGYPSGDESLAPIRDQLLDCWLDDSYYLEFEARSKSSVYSKRGVPVMQGRHRRCASQQGNALLSICKLGLVNDRTAGLAERLLHWQWPDGGWNCDKNPDADSSSFMESLLPLRGLAACARETGDATVKKAVARAAEVFLERQLFKRRSDGSVIHKDFLLLHYPLYWHYDILGGLKAMAEAGFLGDPRCGPALDLLMEMRLSDGGWPALARYYKASRELKPGNDSVNWGGTSKRHMNEWVTADALTVLSQAGRLSI